MTRKDYVRFAAALKSVEPTIDDVTTVHEWNGSINEFTDHVELNTRHSQWLRDVRSIAEVLQADNPRFDWDRFVAAAGVL
jgi:hypothetical protein